MKAAWIWQCLSFGILYLRSSFFPLIFLYFPSCSLFRSTKSFQHLGARIQPSYITASMIKELTAPFRRRASVFNVFQTVWLHWLTREGLYELKVGKHVQGSFVEFSFCLTFFHVLLRFGLSTATHLRTIWEVWKGESKKHQILGFLAFTINIRTDALGESNIQKLKKDYSTVLHRATYCYCSCQLSAFPLMAAKTAPWGTQQLHWMPDTTKAFQTLQVCKYMWKICSCRGRYYKNKCRAFTLPLFFLCKKNREACTRISPQP